MKRNADKFGIRDLVVVKSYQRKRTREELLAGFKLAIAKKREWLEKHNLKELTVAEIDN